MAYLPVEVVIDILARLPVKYLLCLRCVCKPWRSLIDSLDFIHFHILKSIETKTHFGLILRKGFQLFSVDLDAPNGAVELPHPLMSYSNDIKILGSCNGLLCICNVAEDIALWNPSTKMHRLLPFLSSERIRDPGMAIRGPRVYGLGYDAISDDYKLVRVSQFIGLDYQSFESEVKIYSLRTNEWKGIEDLPYALCYTRRMGVHVNGFLHWVVIRKVKVDESELVVALDIVAESYKEVPLPESLNNNQSHLDLGVLGGCLCVVANYREIDVEVWVMREYGVQESWMRLVKLGQSEELVSLKLVRPLTYSKTGDDILFENDHKKLFLCDLKSQRIKDVRICGMPDTFEALVCLSSLVSVNASRGRDSRNQESREDNTRMRDNFLSEGFKLVL
ncbi:F-box domain containing protein [Trema orientale]|uniref:F-box domain containing protein n=1 Tax=Trema orientale TaxID=63057 RepID=A0A2P5CCM1_TREOI|nr:F-box domain containing protein [Trema orientale]